jgi:outer membrane protein OmpA-like peptidoglycan-associated protein
MKFPRNQIVIAITLAALSLSACVSNPSTTPATNAPQGEDPNYDKDGKAKAKVVKVTQTQRGVQISSDERVLFDTGRSDIKPDGMVFAERVATILKTKTQADVVIEGHTDNVGSAALNQQLSTRRADAVKDALVKQGVPIARIKTQGFGLTKPVADNATPEGRQANRRTDIIVLGETEAKISGPAGSPVLEDQLGSGLDRFLKNAGEFFKNVFSGGKKEEPAK